MTIAKHKNSNTIVKRAKKLRQDGSLVERILWRHLRENRTHSEFKFRYQHPLSKYIVDFVCLPAKLVIEIDGLSHDSASQDDQIRQEYIEQLGYQVLRFSNQDIMNDVNSVAETIVTFATKRIKTIRKEKTPPRKIMRSTNFDFSTLPQGEGN